MNRSLYVTRAGLLRTNKQNLDDIECCGMPCKDPGKAYLHLKPAISCILVRVLMDCQTSIALTLKVSMSDVKLNMP